MMVNLDVNLPSYEKQEIIETKVNDIQTKISTGLPFVKSIQRGITQSSGSSTTITISSVNPSKCIVILDGSNAVKQIDYGNGFIFSSSPLYLDSINETSITVKGLSPGGFSKSSFSWQVIEFY